MKSNNKASDMKNKEGCGDILLKKFHIACILSLEKNKSVFWKLPFSLLRITMYPARYGNYSWLLAMVNRVSTRPEYGSRPCLYGSDRDWLGSIRDVIAGV